MSIRILLADDHSIIRTGLRSLINGQFDMEVVGEAENGRDAVAQAKELSPDVVVMDIGMPELNGVDATRKILAEKPDSKVIALSMHADPKYMEQMREAGARGYLLKDCAFEELSKAIHTVIRNKQYVCEQLVPQMQKSPRKSKTPGPLTAREREVLQLVAEGAATKEIASQLGISVKTAESHRQRIMDKLDIRNIAGLTKYALREGLVQLEG